MIIEVKLNNAIKIVRVILYNIKESYDSIKSICSKIKLKTNISNDKNIYILLIAYSTPIMRISVFINITCK